VSFNTVAKLLKDAGEASLEMHDELVRGVKASHIQCDEIWTFAHCKERNVARAKAAPDGAGDLWAWSDAPFKAAEFRCAIRSTWPR
jgi:hypothetical protein